MTEIAQVWCGWPQLLRVRQHSSPVMLRRYRFPQDFPEFWLLESWSALPLCSLSPCIQSYLMIHSHFFFFNKSQDIVKETLGWPRAVADTWPICYCFDTAEGSFTWFSLSRCLLSYANPLAGDKATIPFLSFCFYVNPDPYGWADWGHGSSFKSVVFLLGHLCLLLQFTRGLSPEGCLLQPTSASLTWPWVLARA